MNTTADTRDVEAEGTKVLHFTIDSALLRELGERLVGKPHIALAELIKNSYDADAENVEVSFGEDYIEVADNGHGMDFNEFREFWMRIGTTHKQKERVTRDFKRPMTGSKGVGRLAVQFLASRISIRTVSDKDDRSELQAFVDWGKAVQAGELTEAEARYKTLSRQTTFPANRLHGTRILLRRLRQQWAPELWADLGKEIWWLQPPFRSRAVATSSGDPGFFVDIHGTDTEALKTFREQMTAIQEIWYAKLTGKLEHRKGSYFVRLSLEFSGEPAIPTEYYIDDCKLQNVEFEIRIYLLVRRQPYGISVEKAREYFNEYGGVHVYDAGFHLPFYGKPENDWLEINFDHSHRLSASKLLPAELQVNEGLNFLPTLSRTFGVVHVNTSEERANTESEKGNEDILTISVTRDRLVDNKAYKDLWRIIRWALDFYAMNEAKRRFEEKKRFGPTEPAIVKYRRVDEVLDNYREQLPVPVYRQLSAEVKAAVQAAETEGEEVASQVGLLGSLASAGISALAYEHEVAKQFTLLEDVIRNLSNVRTSDERTSSILQEITAKLEDWINRARATRMLFSPLMDAETRETKAKFKVIDVLKQVKLQVEPLTRGTPIQIGEVSGDLRFPNGTFIEWASVFQNVFLNAFNALVDSRKQLISVSTRTYGRNAVVLVQDTGAGVDVSKAEDLFKPFVRKMKISSERQALGYGGTGLGLTIVKMIANRAGCTVRFVQPDEGFKTAFQMSWRVS